MHIVKIAEQAMLALGIKPIIKPIRGGTDGSRLSFYGITLSKYFLQADIIFTENTNMYLLKACKKQLR